MKLKKMQILMLGLCLSSAEAHAGRISVMLEGIGGLAALVAGYKATCQGAAGVFRTPVILESCTQLLADVGKIDDTEDGAILRQKNLAALKIQGLRNQIDSVRNSTKIVDGAEGICRETDAKLDQCLSDLDANVKSWQAARPQEQPIKTDGEAQKASDREPASPDKE